MKFRGTPEQVKAARARAKLAEAGFPIFGESRAIEENGYRIGYWLSDGVLIMEVLANRGLSL